MPHRFLQLHTLTSYPATLLNRDLNGHQKRITFGDVVRNRISSQCIKRHWRTADDPHSLQRVPLDGDVAPGTLRSRRSFETEVLQPLLEEGFEGELAVHAVDTLLAHLIPEGKAKQAAGEASEDERLPRIRTQQVLVLGQPELRYFREVLAQLLRDAEDLETLGEQLKETVLHPDFKANLRAMRLSAGLDAALFGRMVTGDILSRTDAPVHVAHAMTVHASTPEADYFVAVDDLQGPDEPGTAHLNTQELSTGLYYSHVVVDIPLLVSNLEGSPRTHWEQADHHLAGEVLRRLVHLVATVSPGAKLGSTAPYSYSELVLAELGDQQPRTLANAWLTPASGPGLTQDALTRLAHHIDAFDAMYPRNGGRRLLATLHPSEDLGRLVDETISLPALADAVAADLG